MVDVLRTICTPYCTLQDLCWRYGVVQYMVPYTIQCRVQDAALAPFHPVLINDLALPLDP